LILNPTLRDRLTHGSESLILNRMTTPRDSWSKRFAAYLERNKITQLQAAMALKVGPSQVHYWTTVSTPREKTRRRIERWTRGEVSAAIGEPHLSKAG